MMLKLTGDMDVLYSCAIPERLRKALSVFPREPRGALCLREA